MRMRLPQSSVTRGTEDSQVAWKGEDRDLDGCEVTPSGFR